MLASPPAGFDTSPVDYGDHEPWQKGVVGRGTRRAQHGSSLLALDVSS